MIASDLTSMPNPAGRSRRGIGRSPKPKQCYARAGQYQLEHPDVTLVHGIIDTGLGYFVHAWCELPEGIVFDGADNAFYRTGEYRAHVSVALELRYTTKQAAERVVESGAWANWDLNDGVLADFLRTREGAPG